jgi:hypothetical protein
LSKGGATRSIDGQTGGAELEIRQRPQAVTEAGAAPLRSGFQTVVGTALSKTVEVGKVF